MSIKSTSELLGGLTVQTLLAMTMTAIPGQGMSGDTLRVTTGNALTHRPGCGLPERSRGLGGAVSMAYHNTRINRRVGGAFSPTS